MKIVVFSILAIAIVSGTKANSSTESCTPGERMMKDCNTCFCIDGSGYVCTENVCVEGIFKGYGTAKGPFGGSILRVKRQANPTERTCEPGKAFKHYCNDCRCGPDGLVKSAACTKVGCPEGIFNEDGSLKQPLTDPTPRDRRQANPTERTCEPGKAFKHYCNDCHCGPDGLVKSAACTKIGCPEGIFNEDGSLKQPLTDPTPRDRRQANPTERTCEPGKAFKHYCNDCHCGPDGLVKSAACTKIGCPEGIFNEDGSLKQPLSDPTPRDKRQADGVGATCVPETNFKQYCNICTCPANGLRDSAACTLMACQEGIWNEDGSLKAPLSDPIPRG